MNEIFTIGHSTDTIERFVFYLNKHKIDTVIDVRSVPYSRFVSQFNKERLSAFLRKENINYIPMGENLGARYENRELLFEDGKVDFSKVVATKKFHEGIDRIERGIKKGYKIALMCSEKNPIECHRFSLVSNYLNKNNYIVNHIIGEKVFKHKLLENKLLDYYREHQKLSMDINKIINARFIQGTLFDMNNIDKSSLYVKLNRLVGYNAIGTEREIA